tara:strand:+ start:1699 stop:2370 length:672 start_codon:yes stop_codon:yes gene_type:complete
MPKFLNIFSSSHPKSKEKPKEKIKIIVDFREKSSLVPSNLISLGFQVEFKQLPVADYLIKDIAIERKTVSDLKSSIINKRIISQLLELKQYPKHFLIVEGSQEAYQDNRGLHENALRGFLLSVALEYQVPIIFTKDEKDTAKYLYVLAKKPEKTEFSLRPSKTFKSKKEQLQFILEGFPNVGPTKAKSLIAKFKSLKNIILAPLEDLQEILGSRAQDFKSLLN